jgi:hypothetical protein
VGIRFYRRGTEGAESHSKDLTYRGRLNLKPNILSVTTHANKAFVTGSLLKTFPFALPSTAKENPTHLCVL